MIALTPKRAKLRQAVAAILLAVELISLTRICLGIIGGNRLSHQRAITTPTVTVVR
ncbi:MAG: hypothetical protein HGB11_10510 [Chlorobiales bacterium]|nr:hypothetical protein [Chlorobiales bacterium]